MKSVIISTPMKSLSKGVNSDLNSIEKPADTAEEMVNLTVLRNGVVERRSGRHRVAADDVGSGSGSASKSFFWEPAPGQRHLIQVSSLGVTVDSYNIMSGGSPLVYPATGTQAITKTYYTMPLPGLSPRTTITASEFHENVESLTSLTSSFPTFGSTEHKHYYDIGATRYTYETYIGYPVGSGTLPSSLIDATSSIQFSASRNFVVITGPYMFPLIVWKRPNGTFRADFVFPKMRIYEDLIDGVGIDEQPAAAVTNTNLSLNLLNRGWRAADIAQYKTDTGVWPSKSMVPWKGKNTTGVFTSAELDKIFFNTSSAPTGALLEDILTKNTAVPQVTCAAYGRIWYGGFTGTVMEQVIGYTQPITKKEFMAEDAGALYSYNDPTAEFFNQPTALDGGTIRIEGAKKINRLVPFKDGVVVFAENGVWYISGIQGQAFAGNAFNLYKITDKGCVTGGSVAVTPTMLMYLNVEGIFAISSDEQSRSLTPISMTDNVISRDINNLLGTFTSSSVITGPAPNQLLTTNSIGCYSCYDTKEDKIYIQLGQGVADATTGFLSTYMSGYDGFSIGLPSFTASDIWVYDVKFQAFYKYIAAGSVDEVLPNWDGRATFMIDCKPYRFTVTTPATNQFKDESSLGVFTSYSSYAVISSKNAVVDPDKQIHGIHCSFENSNYGTYPANTDGACKLSVIYDNYSGNGTGRVSPEQDAYRHVPGRIPDYATGNIYRTVQTSLKLRGHGKHFRVKLRSVGEQNFKLIGYSLDISYPATELRRISSGG